MEAFELAPDLWRWTGRRDTIGTDVASIYYKTGTDVLLFDPLLPPEDPDGFWRALDRDVLPGDSVLVLLTSRVAHPQRVPDGRPLPGRPRLWDRRDGGELPAGVTAYRAGGGDELVYWLPAHGALVVGDVVVGDGKGGLKLGPGTDGRRGRRGAARARGDSRSSSCFPRTASRSATSIASARSSNSSRRTCTLHASPHRFRGGLQTMPEIFKPNDYVISRKDLPTVSMGPYRAQWAEWDGYAMAFEVVPRAFRQGATRPGRACPRILPVPALGYLLKGKACSAWPTAGSSRSTKATSTTARPGHKLYAIEAFENLEFNPARLAEQTMDAFQGNIEKAEG